ncbi:unnamed protein product, partial [Didymodactylos carnosus]
FRGEELRHLTNTVFNRSQKLLSLFDMPLMIVINRLLASQTLYFVLNNDPGTNGNSKQNEHPSVYRLGSLIITNILFIPRLKPSISVYEIFNTPIFSNNMSYQVYNLLRFLGIDYKRNTSLAWHNGDNSPYVRSIDDNKWIISVAEDLYCLMKDSDKSVNGNIDNIDNDNIIIKKFAIVNLPCKYELNCGKKIQLKNMKCKRNSVIDYYLISNGDYFKSEELIKLLDAAVTLIFIPVFVVNCVIIILYVKQTMLKKPDYNRSGEMTIFGEL